MSSRRLSAERVGFTLIELLVVIAIILILAAIAVPVLARAAAHARDVQCVSNVRQCSQGMIQYSGNYDGSFPCCYNYEQGWSNWTRYTWREQIMPYVAGQLGDKPAGQITIPTEGRTIFKCTARSQWPVEDVHKAYSVYGINVYIAMWTNNQPFFNNQARYTHIDQVENTSETFLVAENKDGCWGTKPIHDGDPYTNGEGDFKPYHRNDRAPFGYCDGRVTMMDHRASHERKLYIWKLAKRDDLPK